MGYFRELPDLEYQNFLSDSVSSQSYLTVKNLFRRNKLRDDLQNVFTVFDKYEIPEGYRPETVAEDYYGDENLDWVVLITAGILNVRNEWPLSNKDLYDYVVNIYGNDINNILHYETLEIKDSKGKLILPAGKHVNQDFTISYSEDGTYITPTSAKTTRGVSNWEYETMKNNEKQSIFLLKRAYLQQFLNDMRDIMVYQQSSERINDRLSKTENTRVSIPQ